MLPRKGLDVFSERLLRDRGRTRTFLASCWHQRLTRTYEQFSKGKWTPSEPAFSSDTLISLTSWKPRLPDLPLVLLTLIQQTCRPGGINVWLTEGDLRRLDDKVVTLYRPFGVIFRTCDDLKSHKKWLPLLESGHCDPFVICDDDILYPRSWFEGLISENREDSYVGCKCHRIVYREDNSITPYRSWEKQINWHQEPSTSVFVTGCGGAIVHPNRITEEFRDRRTIFSKCPNADDVWLKAAHQAAGFPCYKTKYSFPCLELPESGTSGLAQANVDGEGNDVQIQNVSEFLNQRLRRYRV